ncbi:retrotransposon protein, putative, ty1-copia subclass [Tanacetum coccineum]
MIGNKSYLSDYEEIDGGFVAFRGDPKGGQITGKGKISTGKLDFEDVYFVKELKFNLPFSVTQSVTRKIVFLFTDTKCVVLSPDFQLLDENHVLLRVPIKDNMYSLDLKNIVLLGGRIYGATNKRFDEEIKKIGFTQNPDEPCVYLKSSGSNVAFLVLYVDDILLMQNSVAMLQEVKSWLCKCFSMKDLGESTYILGIKIIRDRSKRLISREILKKFIMENSKKGYTLMMEKPDYRKSQGAKTLLTYNICREFLMLRL